MTQNMGLNLTQRRMTAVKGMGAFLPNQPILHTCVVSPAETAVLQAGDLVTFDTTQTSLNNLIVLKKAANTDVPVGVVVYNAVQPHGFIANDRISIFDTNSYVYMEAGAANLKAGMEVNVNAKGQVVQATAGQGVIGIVYTAPSAIGDLIVIKIKQGSVPAAVSS